MKSKSINIVLIILSIIIFFISMFQSRIVELILRIVSFIINLSVFISSIYMIKNQNKKSIVIIIISIILTLFFGLMSITGFILTIKIETYQKSEDFYIENAKQLEKSLNNSAKFYNREYYVNYIIDNFNNDNDNNIIITKSQAEEKYKEKWYKLKEEDLGICDGYTVISINKDELSNKEYTKEDIIKYLDYNEYYDLLNINTYLSCKNDKYTYTTNNYNKEQIIKENTTEKEVKIRILPFKVKYGFSIDSYNYDEKMVKIYGYGDKLFNIDYLQATYDKEINSSGNYEFTISKSDDILILSKEKINVNLTIGKTKYKKLENINIDFEHLKKDYIAEILDDKFTDVEIKGTDNNINNINNPKVFVDLSGYSDGTHEIMLNCDAMNEFVDCKTKKAYVKIKITKKN